MLDANPHPELSFALDVADKAIKLAAVLLGGVWTYWNYRKSRTYAQKLELQLTGAVFEQDGIFLEASAEIKNLGAARHVLQREDALCELVVISSDLAERSVKVLAVFKSEDQIEPGEAISDLFLHRLDVAPDNIVWLRIDLSVSSGSVEWRRSHLIRLGDIRGNGAAAR
jgi:hypothetical protein